MDILPATSSPKITAIRPVLKDGVERIIDINFLNTDMEFKKFLFKYGNERYNYLHNLSKAMRIVYDQPSLKIESRNYMMSVPPSSYQTAISQWQPAPASW